MRPSLCILKGQTVSWWESQSIQDSSFSHAAQSLYGRGGRGMSCRLDTAYGDIALSLQMGLLFRGSPLLNGSVWSPVVDVC